MMNRLEKVYAEYVGTADKPLELISIILSEDCPMDYGMDGDECEKTDCFHCWMKEVEDDE